MIPIFFQFTRSDSALEAGVRLRPFIFLMIFAVIGNGAILSAYGLYMPRYVTGGILVILGGALLHTIDPSTTTATVYGYIVLVGFGTSLYAQASFSVAQAIDPSLIASAVDSITYAQVSGVTIALAIANSVFINRSQTKIGAILPGVPASEIQAAIAGPGSEFVKTLDASTRAKVLEAIFSSISNTYILVIVAGCVTLVSSLR